MTAAFCWRATLLYLGGGVHAWTCLGYLRTGMQSRTALPTMPTTGSWPVLHPT